MVQWQRLRTPNAGGLGSIPGWATESHMHQLRVCMKQLKISHPATEIGDPVCCAQDSVQPNKYLKKNKYRLLVQRCNHIETDNLSISREVKPLPTVGPSHSMPGIYPGEKEKYMSLSQKDFHTVLPVTLFVIAKKKKKTNPQLETIQISQQGKR